MARMIPAYCADSAPPGEKAVYAALRDAPLTEHWIALHSLNIARHESQVEGEADFIIVAPNLGIIVIEVKSHLSVARDPDGMWRLGRDRPTGRSPFEQAKDAKHSILSFLRNKRVSTYDFPLLHAVWFTGVRARASLPPSPEWHSWQVLDAIDVQRPVPALEKVFEAGKQHLASSIRGFDSSSLAPSQVDTEHIAAILRPRFELVVTAGDRRRVREGQLAQFVEEQYRALDAAAENMSVLFTGPAGTGKTFLAVESAQREIAQGRKGRLLCFNRLLGRSLSEKLSGVAGLRVGTLHQEMLRLAGLTAPPDGAGIDFWEHVLPDLALEGLADGGSDELGEFLIIDEVQDLATESYLPLIDLLVEGGLSGGRVLLFGDFERQAIYGRDGARDYLRDHTPRMASFRLSENCRNLPRIGYQANLMGRLTPGFNEFRRPDDGVDPRVATFTRGDDQSALLRNAVAELRDEGFDLSEIVVLSPLRENSVASNTSDTWLRQVLRPMGGPSQSKGRLRFSTIHGFKGLDAPAIIVTDLDDAGGPKFDSLLYIGLTRATDRLTALVEKSTLRRLVGGMK